MSNNPYSPPETASERDFSEEAIARRRAETSLRIALCILSVPAAYNYYWFNLRYAANPLPSVDLMFAIDAAAGIAVFVGVWFFGLPLLELATLFIHRLLGRAVLQLWNAELYAVLRRAVVLSIAGALVWGVWVLLFYSSSVNFFVISIPAGILAHLLAAALYLPLFYRWFRIEKIERASRL